MTTSNSSDSELTACALAGQRDAFAQIVSRYQSLVCSLALFPLLLLTVYLRWERWTGQPAWQAPGDALFYIAIGFLLFAFFVINWLLKRNQ